MISELDFMFKNGIILFKHENSKTGAALALYNIDASTWGERKTMMLKDSLIAKKWVSVENTTQTYIMCKNEIKMSISRKITKAYYNGVEKDVYSVSAEFNSGTKYFCK
ncbi:hypothetical protein GCM10027093_18060 [Paraburkholderia jirisanensis]